jgi:predicted nuclease of predicted toxin-antitoxin system
VSLLFDENLSHRLIRRLEAAYPRSEHVELVGLKGQVDLEVWEYAAHHDATIVSKDNDFRQLSFLRGHPPKVICREGLRPTFALRSALPRSASGRKRADSAETKS